MATRFNSTALGMGILTIGGSLAAVCPLRADIDDLIGSYPDRIYDLCLILGLFLCLCGLLLVLAGVLQHLAALSKRMQHVREYIEEKLSDPRFERAVATLDQFEELFELSRHILGDEIAPEIRERMREWYGKNPNYLWSIQRVKVGDGVETRRLAGFFSIFPLNKRATKLCERGDFSGAQIRSEDLVGPNSVPAGVYIGAIAANTPRARSFALGVLMERLDKILKRGVALYTRPVTRDGRRLISKYGFIAVDTESRTGKEDAGKAVHKLVRPSIAKVLDPKINRRKKRAQRRAAQAA
jgi:hypothetical protein